MNRKFLRLLLAAILLITASIAEAQEAAKVPRIGYLTADSRSGRGDVRAEAFRQGLRALGYTEGKTLSLSGGRQRENSIAFTPLRPS